MNPTINLMKESQELWNNWAEEMDFDFLQTGYLYLLYTEDEVEQYEKMQELQNSLGVPSRMLDTDEIKDICEYIDVSNVKAGSYNPEDGKAHPFKVILELKNT